MFTDPKQLHVELKSLEPATKASISEVKAGLNKLKASTRLMKGCADLADPSDAIRDVMGQFLDSYADDEVRRLSEQIQEMENETKSVIKFLGEDASKAKFEEVCNKIFGFLNNLKAADRDNQREVELAAKRSARANRVDVKNAPAPAGGKSDGLFAAFSKDQQDGDAKDIVERIRSKQKRVRQSVKVSMAPPKPRKKSGDSSQRVSNPQMLSLLQGGGIQEEEEEEDENEYDGAEVFLHGARLA